MTTRAGSTLGRYRLIDRIGAGGMGEVWKAHDTNLDREVAIKVLNQGAVSDSDTHARFRREALVLSRLSHPGAIADALDDAHGHGILHRDLKPGNIVLTHAGQPKILDFGIALLMGAEPGAAKLTRTGMILGSLPYMAPEQLTGEADDARTDIYSLGVMLFEMTTGRRPFVKERAFAHNLLARALYAFEQFDEALDAALRSVQLDPLSSLIRTVLGDAHYFARQYEKSVFHYRMAIELDPRFDGAHTDLARTLEALGRFDEARDSYEAGRRLGGGIAGPTFGLAHLEAAAGNEVEARKILEELISARGSRVVSAWGIAAMHAALGDVDVAFEWLETAIKEKASGLILLRVHPRLDPIRNDPRYWPMVERVGLATLPGQI